MMRALVQRAFCDWRPADTLMLVTNLLAFVCFLANAALHSVILAYVGALVALGPQVVGACRWRGRLGESVAFGALLAGLWIVGDAATIHLAGAWGTYDVPGPRLWETPPLALLMGWLSATHLHYWTRRVMAWGLGSLGAAAFAGLSAIGLGTLGESLFVEAGLWSYAEAAWVWWRVPAFVPIAYGLAFAALPLLFRRPWPVRALLLALLVLVTSVGLGFAVGFFPR